jgi:hypothetical protein
MVGEEEDIGAGSAPPTLCAIGASVILRREGPKNLAAAVSARPSDSTTGEILRGCAAQDD